MAKARETTYDPRPWAEFCHDLELEPPAGPWDNEPDDLRWTDDITGYTCWMKRNPLHGNWCGYVQVPRDHPWHGWPLYSNTRPSLFSAPYRLVVHGDVTLADSLLAEGDWWFGFDCVHWDDLTPVQMAMGQTFGVYRDVPYVLKMTTNLAFQLAGVDRLWNLHGTTRS